MELDLGDGARMAPLQLRDVADFWRVATSNGEYLGRFLNWISDGFTRRQARDLVAASQLRRNQGQGYWLGLWQGDSFAGCTAFNSFRTSDRSTEISFWLDENQQGKGLVTRACRAMVDHAFFDLELNRVEIHCARENHRSRAVAERLGFEQEGVLRQASLVRGRFFDVVVYGCVASDWSGSQELSVSQRRVRGH